MCVSSANGVGMWRSCSESNAMSVSSEIAMYKNQIELVKLQRVMPISHPHAQKWIRNSYIIESRHRLDFARFLKGQALYDEARGQVLIVQKIASRINDSTLQEQCSDLLAIIPKITAIVETSPHFRSSSQKVSS